MGECKPPYKYGDKGKWCDCEFQGVFRPECYEYLKVDYSCNSLIVDADYLVVNYKFIDGSDLDTRTSIDYDTEYGSVVGWCKGSSYKNWYTWGGDNTGTGYESVVVYVKNIRDSNPEYDGPICGRLAAFWYGYKASGVVNLELLAYKGGTMLKSGLQWINEGGDLVATLTTTATVATQTGTCYDGDLVTYFTYSKDNTFSWENCSGTPGENSPCKTEFELETDGCCIEYLSDSKIARAVGDGLISVVSGSFIQTPTNCCNKIGVYLNGSAIYSSGNYFSKSVKDGDVLSVNIYTDCRCKDPIKTLAGTTYKPPECPKITPYRILKDTLNNKYKIILNKTFFRR